MSDFLLVLRSLRSRLLSTIITIASVALAVALVLVLLVLPESARKTFERGTGDMHLLISADASPLASVLNGVMYASPPQRPLTFAKYGSLREGFPWKYAQPVAFGDSWRGAPVVGVMNDFHALFKPAPDSPFTLRTGRWLGEVIEGEAAPTSFEAVVGAEVAQRAGLRLGDTLYITHGFRRGEFGQIAGDLVRAGGRAPQAGGHDHDHDESGPAHVHFDYGFRVVGILSQTITPHDRCVFIPLDGAWIMHAQDRLAKSNQQGSGPGGIATRADLIESDKLITGIYARLLTREGSDTPANLQAVFDQLRRDQGITVAQPAQQVRQLFGIIDNVHRLFLAMGVVVMLSSGVGILLAMYNSMDQRRRQTAIYRVLGATRGRILSLTLAESVLIGLAGGVCGVLLAWGGLFLSAGALRSRLGLDIEPHLDPRALVLVIAGAVVLACLAGLLPAILAYRVSVAKHLRPTT